MPAGVATDVAIEAAGAAACGSAPADGACRRTSTATLSASRSPARMLGQRRLRQREAQSESVDHEAAPATSDRGEKTIVSMETLRDDVVWTGDGGAAGC